MRAVGRIAVAATGLLALLTVLGTLGALWWAFDILANFRAQYLLGALVMLVVTAVSRKPKWIGVALLVAAANAAVIAPLYLRNPAPAAGDDALSVVTFNIQLSNPQRQLGWILESDPDVVFIFESSRLAEETLAELDLPYEIFSAIDDDRQYGPTALIRPGMSASKLAFSNEGGGAVRVETVLGGAPVAVFGIHPPSPSTPWRAEARDRFLERSAAAIADEAIPVVVAGDFNATPWSRGFRLLTGPADLANSQEGFGYASTWPAQLPAFLRIPLDHVLHSRNLTVISREVGPTLSSDHRPVRAEIAFAE